VAWRGMQVAGAVVLDDAAAMAAYLRERGEIR